MSILTKLMDTIRIDNGESDDDDYFLDDDYVEDERPAKKSIFHKKTVEEDFDDYDEEPETSKPRFMPRTATTGNNGSKVVPMRRGMEVSLVKPTSMDDGPEICDYLLAGKAVVLNMEGIGTDTAQRIIDFASGAAYSMNGNLQKISNYIFIVTPQSVELSGDFPDSASEKSKNTEPLRNVSGLNIRM